MTPLQIVFLVALTAYAVGVARGKLTRLFVEPDGRIYSQGTALCGFVAARCPPRWPPNYLVRLKRIP